VTHTTAALVASPVVSTMPLPLNHTLGASQSSREFDTNFVVAHWPWSGNLPSVRSISQLHLLKTRLGDLLVFVVHGTDRKFVPSSVLSCNENGDVDGGAGRVGLSDGSSGESSPSLMSQRSLDRVTAKTAGAVVFVPLVAETTAVALVILVIARGLEAETPCRCPTRWVLHVSMGVSLMDRECYCEAEDDQN